MQNIWTCAKKIGAKLGAWGPNGMWRIIYFRTYGKIHLHAFKTEGGQF
jgi:hypothetical protein